PRLAQPSAMQNVAIRVSEMARPIGEGGVSTISSVAGRKASPSTGRSWRAPGTAARALADDFMDPRLQAMQGRVAAAGADQLVMAAILDETRALQRQDAMAAPHGRQAMGDDDDGAVPGDAVHVLLDDPLA